MPIFVPAQRYDSQADLILLGPSLLHHHLSTTLLGAGPALEVDWMPLPDSKLRRFLDAVRNAAAAGSTGSTETASLGGAVIEWQERPKIVKVLPKLGRFAC